MADQVEPIPGTEEVKIQLARLLNSDRFRTARNPADFLSLAVHRAIGGKKTTEDVIGKALFGPEFSKEESADVRVTAINLRKALDKYYASEGADDPVIIALPKPSADRSVKLPPGEAYRPLFRYNPNHTLAQEYALGVYHLRPNHQYKSGIALLQELPGRS